MSDQNSTTPDPSEAVPGYQPPASSDSAVPPTTPSYQPPAYEPPAAPGGYQPPAVPQQPAAPGYEAPAAGGYQPPAAPEPPVGPYGTPAAGAYGQQPASGFPPAAGYGQQPGAFPPAGYPVAPVSPVGGAPLADWTKRALGGLVDYVAPAIVFGVVGNIVGAASSSLGSVVSAVLGIAWWVYLGYKSGTTGVTFGRSIAKTKLISEENGQVIGSTNGIIRQFAHIIDSIICYIGWLFPLWDVKRQTIADKIMKTVVIDNAQDPNAGTYNWNL